MAKQRTKKTTVRKAVAQKLQEAIDDLNEEINKNKKLPVAA